MVVADDLTSGIHYYFQLLMFVVLFLFLLLLLLGFELFKLFLFVFFVVSEDIHSFIYWIQVALILPTKLPEPDFQIDRARQGRRAINITYTILRQLFCGILPGLFCVEPR